MGGMGHTKSNCPKCCTHCKAPGHRARACPKKLQCHQCNVFGHKAVNCPKKLPRDHCGGSVRKSFHCGLPILQCHHCGLIGHTATACLSCRYCDVYGHRSNDCPEVSVSQFALTVKKDDDQLSIASHSTVATDPELSSSTKQLAIVVG